MLQSSRLVAKGDIQQEGIDYLETFCPIAKLPTVRRLLLATVIKNKKCYIYKEIPQKQSYNLTWLDVVYWI